MKSRAPALIALILLSAAGPGDPDLAGARAFVQDLYAHYPARRGRPVFDPVGKQAPQVFDPGIVALLKADDANASPGDVGAVDGDPICDCQDDGGLAAEILSVRAAGPGRATASVALKWAEARPPDVRRIELSLVLLNRRWRVFDIKTRDTPSFRAYLKASLAPKRRAH